MTTTNPTGSNVITHHCRECGAQSPDGNNLCHPSAVVESIISTNALPANYCALYAALEDTIDLVNAELGGGGPTDATPGGEHGALAHMAIHADELAAGLAIPVADVHAFVDYQLEGIRARTGFRP